MNFCINHVFIVCFCIKAKVNHPTTNTVWWMWIIEIWLLKLIWHLTPSSNTSMDINNMDINNSMSNSVWMIQPLHYSCFLICNFKITKNVNKNAQCQMPSSALHPFQHFEHPFWFHQPCSILILQFCSCSNSIFVRP